MQSLIKYRGVRILLGVAYFVVITAITLHVAMSSSLPGFLPEFLIMCVAVGSLIAGFYWADDCEELQKKRHESNPNESQGLLKNFITVLRGLVYLTFTIPAVATFYFLLVAPFIYLPVRFINGAFHWLKYGFFNSYTACESINIFCVNYTGFLGLDKILNWLGSSDLFFTICIISCVLFVVQELFPFENKSFSDIFYW